MGSKVFLTLCLAAFISMVWADLPGYGVQQLPIGDNTVVVQIVSRNRTGARAWCKDYGYELLKITAAPIFQILMSSTDIPVGTYWIDGVQDKPIITGEADCTNATVNIDGIPSSSKEGFNTGCISITKTGAAHTNKLTLGDCNVNRNILCSVPTSLVCPVQPQP